MRFDKSGMRDNYLQSDRFWRFVILKLDHVVLKTVTWKMYFKIVTTTHVLLARLRLSPISNSSKLNNYFVMVNCNTATVIPCFVRR